MNNLFKRVDTRKFISVDPCKENQIWTGFVTAKGADIPLKGIQFREGFDAGEIIQLISLFKITKQFC